MVAALRDQLLFIGLISNYSQKFSKGVTSCPAQEPAKIAAAPITTRAAHAAATAVSASPITVKKARQPDACLLQTEKRPMTAHSPT